MKSFQSFKTCQLISTHRDGGVLDLILTSEIISSDICNVQVYPEGTRSDHYMVSCEMKCDPERVEPTTSTKTYRNFKTINVDNFKTDLRASPLCVASAEMSSDVDNLANMYNEELLKLMDKHCPVIHKTVNKNSKKRKRDVWFDDDLYILLRKCRSAERKWYRTRSSEDKAAYRTLEKQYSDLVRNKRQLHDSGVIIRNKRDKRKLFKKINEMLGNEKRMLPHSNNDSQLAEEFSKFFDSKIKEIYSDIDDEKINNDVAYDDCGECNFVNDSLPNFVPLAMDDLSKLLLSMNNKFCCLDPIPTWLLIECISELLPFLLKIVNSSLESGIFPSASKKAIIKPSIKDIKECPDSFRNYRPVSNISFLSKLCEKAVLSQLNEYLDKNKLLCSQQSGYRRFHSCETLNLKLFDDILKCLDEGSTVALLLLDLSAAFDTVDHKLLLKLLETNYGIKSTALQWFENYLQGRSCAVNIASSFSDFVCLLFGVPQGSILGPILFIMYTKHIQHIAKKYGLCIQLYADDTQLYIAFKRNFESIELRKRDIENCISEIKIWMCSMSLKLNEGKTKLLFLNKPSVESTVITNFPIQACLTEIVGIDWQKEKDIKSLGVLLDEHFKLTNHLSFVRKYCFGQLTSWKRIAPSLTEDVKLLLVKQIILSKVDNNSLFAGLPDTYIQSLQSIVNCGIRFVYNLRKRDHITPYIMKSHILPVKYRIDYKVCILVFNCLNNCAPAYLKDLLKWNIPSRASLNIDNVINNNPPRRTQDPLLLEIPTDFGNKTRCRSRCFSHYAPRCWNKLPYELRSYTNKDIFINNLKTYFFNLYITDFNIEIT